MSTDYTPAEAGTGGLEKLAATLGSIAQEFGEWTVDVQRQNEIAVALAAAVDALNAHRCSLSVVPSDTATEGGNVFQRAVEAIYWTQNYGCDPTAVAQSLADAGLLATAGTGGEAEYPAVRALSEREAAE